MKIIVRPRGGGKTYDLLQMMQKDPNLFYVTAFRQMAASALRLSRDLDMDIAAERFLSVAQILNGTRKFLPHARFVVDELEAVLGEVFRFKIETVTTSSDVDYIPNEPDQTYRIVPAEKTTQRLDEEGLIEFIKYHEKLGREARSLLVALRAK